MKTVKAITYAYTQDGVQSQKIVGVYAPDKVEEGLNEVKKSMQALGKKLVKESKDCCNYFLEFESQGSEKEYFYTGDYILNELNL